MAGEQGVQAVRLAVPRVGGQIAETGNDPCVYFGLGLKTADRVLIADGEVTEGEKEGNEEAPRYFALRVAQ